MMRNLMLSATLAGMVALSACGKTESAQAPEAEPAPHMVQAEKVDCNALESSGDVLLYSCDGNKMFSATHDAGFACAFVSAGGQLYKVQAQAAASGNRYAEGDIEYWEKGEEAFLHGAAGGPYDNCKQADAH